MSIDNNQVLSLLRSITDPSSGNDIISMKLVSELKVKKNAISLAVNTKGLADTVKFQLHETIHSSLKEKFGTADINIHFTNADNPAGALSHIKNIIAVASGKGGVGKSTVSTNLALSLVKQGAKVGLIDADLYGPSIPTMLDIAAEKPVIKQLYGRHRIIPIEKYGLQTISIGNIIDPEQAVVLRGPRLGGIIKQFINEVIWPELDYMIIDLPPGTGDIQLTLVQTIPITGALIVTTPQKVAVADAIKAMNMFRLENIRVPILGVVENMSWFIPDDAPDKKYKLFGEGGGEELAKIAKSAFLGKLPLIPQIREAGDKGSPVVLEEGGVAGQHYRKLASNLLKELQVRVENLPPTQIVAVNIQK